jgi:hypothetical protein
MLGVEMKCKSVGWFDVLKNTLPLIDEPNEDEWEDKAALKIEMRNYNNEILKRQQLTNDCMSALYMAVAGPARDAIKFCNTPSEAIQALKDKRYWSLVY